VKTDRSREISAKGSVLDANRLDGIGLDKMDGITCKEEMASLKRGRFHAWILNIDHFTKLQVVNDPGFSSTMRFRRSGSTSFPFNSCPVDNVSVMTERRS